MRIAVAILALLPLAAAVDAAPSRGVRPADELRLVFLDADASAPVRQSPFGDAALDVGRVVATQCPRSGCMRTVVKRRFRLRVDGAGTSRFVRVRAHLQTEMPGQRVLVDGRLLTSTPQLIDSVVPVRVAVAHTLVIEVPVSEPEGLLAHAIVWLVEDIK